MPFVTTNIISLTVHNQLDKQWGMQNGNSHTQMKMGAENSVHSSKSYLSLPIKERMQWVEGNVLPKLSLPTSSSRTELMLQSVGADSLYPHADKLGVFRMRSVGC
jgi:hypothetical protein